MKRLISILLVLLAAGAASGQSVTYHYATHDGHPLYMDCYQPDNPRADHAAVLYVFGGGFIEGARDNRGSRRVCEALASRGFQVYAIDYRLGLKGIQFDTVHLLKSYRLFAHAIDIAVEDCCAALAFLCGHAAELGVDTSRIVLMGSSAGAITVLQTDYARANALPVARDLPQGFRPAVVAPYAGAIYTHNRKMCYATPPAPTIFFHGTTDKIVHYRRFRASLHTSLFGADKVVRCFKKNDYPHAILRFEDRGHDVAAYMPYTLDEFCAFVDLTLAGRRIFYDATCRDAALKPTKWSKMNIFDLYLGSE